MECTGVVGLECPGEGGMECTGGGGMECTGGGGLGCIAEGGWAMSFPNRSWMLGTGRDGFTARVTTLSMAGVLSKGISGDFR